MQQNRVKRIMREGGLAIVSHVGFADPAVIEIIAMAGFDGAFIDMEHTVFDLQLVGEMIRVAELTGITPIVRVPDNDAKLILRVLDAGAQGIQVPHIEGLEGAKRAGVVLAIHLCRGNNRSQWYAEGGYDAIAEKLFGQLHVDAFLLEYESERAGSFEPLRFVPRDKTVVLGLVSSKLPELESQDQLKRRIGEASKYVPLENLALSPQCGFASTMEGNLLTEDEQWRKLKLVVDTATQVWGQA